MKHTADFTMMLEAAHDLMQQTFRLVVAADEVPCPGCEGNGEHTVLCVAATQAVTDATTGVALILETLYEFTGPSDNPNVQQMKQLMKAH